MPITTTAVNTANLQAIIAQIHFSQVIKALLLIVVGFFIARTISSWFNKLAVKRLAVTRLALFRKIVFYIIFILFLLAALDQLGFSLSVLLGAAGILTIALGFAAQLSVSNLISGLFMIAEQPFKIGDSITVDTVSGEVLSIDALSIKIRTAENTMVRIPNETLIKNNITNLSRFPIRRLDLILNIAYQVEAEKVRATLLQVVKDNAYCLPDPAPTVSIAGFSDGGINWLLSVYVKQENYTPLKSTLLEQIKNAFDRDGIPLAYPIRNLYFGSQSSLPVHISSEKTP